MPSLARDVQSIQVMKRITGIIAAAALAFSVCMPMQARSKTLDEFITKVSSSLVSFDYSFVCQVNGTKMTGEGSALLQDDCFKVEGNGLDIRCDGKTRWTLDTFAEEAVIEPVDESSEDGFAVNPALIVTAVDKAFNEMSSGTSKFGGVVVDVSVLAPQKNGKSSSDIARLKLYFKKGTQILSGAEVTLNDGTVSTFTLKNFTFSDKLKDKEPFRLDEKTLDSDYVVTDLR